MSAATLTRPKSRRPPVGSVLVDPAALARRAVGLPLLRSEVGEPTWEIAERLYPRQGAWTEEDYFRLRPSVDRTVEFVDGFLDFHGEVLRESAPGEPTWEVAEFAHPRQGSWTEEEYLEVGAACGGKVEFVGGLLEFHAMARRRHSRLVRFLWKLLERYADDHLPAEVLTELTCIIVRGHADLDDSDRLPDLVLIPAADATSADYPTAAEIRLAAEIVSPDRESVERDHGAKRAEYAAAGIPEYWIVDPTDPADPFVLVLTLPDGASVYAEHGTFRPGQTATSPSQPGLSCDVADLFAAAGIGAENGGEG